MFLILPGSLSIIFFFENLELKILILGFMELSFKERFDDMVELFYKIS
jgi:hypothetical protein